jgi:hypothetical protein
MRNLFSKILNEKKENSSDGEAIRSKDKLIYELVVNSYDIPISNGVRILEDLESNIYELLDDLDFLSGKPIVNEIQERLKRLQNVLKVAQEKTDEIKIEIFPEYNEKSNIVESIGKEIINISKNKLVNFEHLFDKNIIRNSEDILIDTNINKIVFSYVNDCINKNKHSNIEVYLVIYLLNNDLIFSFEIFSKADIVNNNYEFEDRHCDEFEIIKSASFRNMYYTFEDNLFFLNFIVEEMGGLAKIEKGLDDSIIVEIKIPYLKRIKK